MYGGTVFLSAFLLFLIEPMAAKELLPVLGGSSAVWVTCLVFFQATLLLGYLYAHRTTRGNVRVRVHLAVLVLAVGVVGLGWFAADKFVWEVSAITTEHPVRTIFGLLAMTIGIPFLVLGSTSPLLQVWLARKEQGVVWYPLFALSNAGSLLALVVYPVLIEPHVTLGEQWRGWAVAFVAYAWVCGLVAWRSRVGEAEGPRSKVWALEARGEVPEFVMSPDAVAPVPFQDDRSVDNKRRAMWFLLPMGAAMQLSAVTSHLTQDIAAIPLLWVLPLAVYLITFILAFEVPVLYRRWVAARFLVVMLASLGYALSKVDTGLPVGLAVLFYLVEVFAACWFCHAEVYALRPKSAAQSTAFYLMVAAGGVAGTFLVGIASPLVFRANYDLAFAFLVTAALALVVTWRDGWGQRVLWGAATALLLALTVLLHVEFARKALVQVRNFYGALRVTQANIDSESATADPGPVGEYSNGSGPVRVLMNGRIRHGTQMLETAKRRTPTTYYGAESGVGLALRSCCEGRTKNVGVIGLGVGTIAAYGQAGDRMRFYEINPLVEPIARNLFTYLSDSPAAITVVEGDGRASLAKEAPQGFDVLVVDAFSGDAIPLHLLTREAMAVYRRHLAPGGVIAFHVSNSYLDLGPEIGKLASSAGMQARQVEGVPVRAAGAYRSTWVLVSDDAAFFARPEVAGASTPIVDKAGLRVWTDDYSSLLPVFRWGL